MEDYTPTMYDKYKDYQLCYVDTISKTFWIYDERSRALMETPEYKVFANEIKRIMNDKLNTRGSYTMEEYERVKRWLDPKHKFRLESIEVETEESKAGYTHELYFTNDLENQWGDDWDDTPYEYNAGIPYDSDTDVVRIFVTLPEGVEFPCRNMPNSPYSVEDINHRAVAWMYYNKIAILAGETLSEVLEKLKLYV